VEGRVLATVEQLCRVTKETLRDRIIANFTCYAHEQGDTVADVYFPVGETKDMMDIVPVKCGIIDLGEIAAQYLGLNINRFPVSSKVDDSEFPSDEEDFEEGYQEIV
jgi:hypothetical protein